MTERLRAAHLRFGGTSWVVNGSFADNMRELSRCVDSMQFVLFDNKFGCNIPSAEEVSALAALQEELGMAIIMITHDLGVVAGMADYVVVMYAGRVIEKGTASDIYHHPSHPYTIGLMKSKPVVGHKSDTLYNIPGNVPNPVNMPNYCYFRDRCEMRCEQCNGDYPPAIKINDTHVVSCYRFIDKGEVLGYPKAVNVEEL